jgi:hypothetical protein
MDVLWPDNALSRACWASYHNSQHNHMSSTFVDEPMDHPFLDNLHSLQHSALPPESDLDAGILVRVGCCFLGHCVSCREGLACN